MASTMVSAESLHASFDSCYNISPVTLVCYLNVFSCLLFCSTWMLLRVALGFVDMINSTALLYHSYFYFLRQVLLRACTTFEFDIMAHSEGFLLD